MPGSSESDDGMHVIVCIDQTSVYTLTEKSFRNWESAPMFTPREKSPLPETQRMVEPVMLYNPGQQVQQTTD